MRDIVIIHKTNISNGMEKKYLIVNRGSASEKYAIYTKEKCLGFLHMEKLEIGDGYLGTLYIDGIKEEKSITKKEFQNSLNYALNIFINSQIISSKADISGIGIRIVAPGKHFQDDKVIDKVYEQYLKKILHDAPLHILPTFKMIQGLKKMFKGVPIVGVSDSDIHDTIPDKAKYYPLPFAFAEKHEIQKYGYHSISIESILHRLKAEEGRIPGKLIICHIGSGVSITAVKDGKSIENSMGYTPLEGLMMATRAGDIDPGVITLISDSFGFFKGNKLKEYLNKKCGLFGVSEKSSDIRDLIKLEKEGNVQAKLALDMYVYRIQKYIGSYYVALGGLDTIIFTATVGERSFVMRERICNDLEVLGVKINKIRNNQSEGINAEIESVDSKVKILVRKTDEVEQIARDTVRVLGL